MKPKLITVVIVCDGYSQAVDAFHMWVKHLKETEPGYVKNENEASLSVELTLFRYIFCDYHVEDVLSEIADSIMYLDEFALFEGLEYEQCLERMRLKERNAV